MGHQVNSFFGVYTGKNQKRRISSSFHLSLTSLGLKAFCKYLVLLSFLQANYECEFRRKLKKLSENSVLSMSPWETSEAEAEKEIKCHSSVDFWLDGWILFRSPLSSLLQLKPYPRSLFLLVCGDWTLIGFYSYLLLFRFWISVALVKRSVQQFKHLIGLASWSTTESTRHMRSMY